MEIAIIFQIAAVGLLVAIINQILDRAGRQEYSMVINLAGLCIVLFWILKYLGELFNTLKDIFTF